MPPDTASPSPPETHAQSPAEHTNRQAQNEVGPRPHHISPFPHSPFKLPNCSLLPPPLPTRPSPSLLATRELSLWDHYQGFKGYLKWENTLWNLLFHRKFKTTPPYIILISNDSSSSLHCRQAILKWLSSQLHTHFPTGLIKDCSPHPRV